VTSNHQPGEELDDHNVDQYDRQLCGCTFVPSRVIAVLEVNQKRCCDLQSDHSRNGSAGQKTGRNG
jgi:hypothetical protein